MKTNLNLKLAHYNNFKKVLERKADKFPGTEIVLNQFTFNSKIQVTYSIFHPEHGQHIGAFDIHGWDNPENPELYREISIIHELFIYKPIPELCPKCPKIIRRLEKFMYNHFS